MTNTAGVQRPAPKLGRAARWKLTEPVLFYIVPPLLLLLFVLVMRAAAYGHWSDFLLAELPVFVIIGGGVWSARASVYSPRGLMVALREAFENR